ncbi:type IV conjugative transfer system protein TraE [Duganella vulcania]|uniref:Type IV conjugative transfer system protein TraE n=1 Tax=Duganella vulcania TaxID=2692166 RepID=A0A845GNS1_9BURK|nr:type IV conjugative transfer system protein TraE [Duganella vulcania]MYM95924.1 type IV conjugative transfer system protein TraE [Duganella vulcania]
MLNDDYEATLTDLRRAILGRSIIIGTLAVALLVLATCLYRIIGTERIIVTPPSVNATFWCQGDQCGSAYLEQMGGYVAWLILDVAPTSIEWKKSALLGFVAADTVGALKERQELEADRLKRLNASTYFLLQQLTPDEEKQTVRMVGLLHTQINGHDTPPVTKTYEAAFVHTGGKTHLASFTEIKQNGQASLAGGVAAAGGR